jgi:hypothetical protein
VKCVGVELRAQVRSRPGREAGARRGEEREMRSGGMDAAMLVTAWLRVGYA